jgi:hypothetical protein
MGSTPHPTVIRAAILAAAMALQAPALAQGNQDNPPHAPVPAPAQSQQAQPQEAPSPPPQAPDDRRFTFHRIEGGFVRLDMRTGELASCAPKGADWNCTPGGDERAALDREIAQLRRDNAILKNTLLEHGVPLPDGMAPNPPARTGRWSGDEEPVPRPPQTVPPTASAPGTAQDDEIDRIMTAVEKGWRRLVEMVTNLQRDLQKKE